MKAISAKDAKNNFGTLMDTAQQEPVTIEKHGRPVAVIMSAKEYQKLKMQRFKSEVEKGIDQLDRGESINGENLFEKYWIKEVKGTDLFYIETPNMQEEPALYCVPKLEATNDREGERFLYSIGQ